MVTRDLYIFTVTKKYSFKSTFQITRKEAKRTQTRNIENFIWFDTFRIKYVGARMGEFSVFVHFFHARGTNNSMTFAHD